MGTSIIVGETFSVNLPEQARDLEPAIAMQLSREIAELNEVILQRFCRDS